MGSLKLGNNNINDVKFGNNQVTKVYLGTNLIWTGGTVTPPSYSAELQAIINFANSQGWTIPSQATLIACDALITTYKSTEGAYGGSFWDTKDAIYNFAYNDTTLTNFSRINWKAPNQNPSYTIIINGGVTYQAGGFMGNGIDGYLDMQYHLYQEGNWYNDDATRIMFIYTPPTIGTAFDGTPDSSQGNGLFNENSSKHNINYTSTSTYTPTIDMTGGGLKAITRDSSINTTNFYTINRTVASTRIQTSYSIFGPQYILRNVNNYSNAVVSMYCIGYGITTNAAGIIRTAYNTYLTSIGLSPNTNP
jgi:hypothetical protein